jgi:uncharacterized protein (TIGR02611 family)
MATETPERSDRSPRSEPKLVTRLREQRHRHRDRHAVVRALWVIAGFTLLLAGIAMLVAPGPAFVVIPIGLAILSLEFTWAERLLERSLDEADKAARKAAETTPMQRLLAGVATALAVAAVAAWAIFGDIPLLPV